MNIGTVCIIVLAALVIGWIVNKVRTTIATKAPLGYEDEAGFHFGAPSFDK
jgi:hypothetical protein